MVVFASGIVDERLPVGVVGLSTTCPPLRAVVGVEPGRLVPVGGLGTLLGPEGSRDSFWASFAEAARRVWWGCWWVWCLVVEQWTRASGEREFSCLLVCRAI
jgi:hypothetical protein